MPKSENLPVGFTIEKEITTGDMGIKNNARKGAKPQRKNLPEIQKASRY